MKAAQIQFDADTHTYYDGELVVPSVTQIIQGLGLVDTFGFNESHALRGVNVHHYSEQIDTDNFDPFSIDQDLIGYVRAYEQFKKEFMGTVMVSESRVYDPVRCYAGTLDRIVQQDGINYVLDIKTGVKQRWHKIQLGAYWGAYPYMDDKLKLSNEGLILSLAKDGKYKIEVVDGMRQWANMFHSCCAVYHFKNPRGKK